MGRLSNENKKNAPTHTEDAEHFMRVISSYYDEYKGKFFKFARDNGYEVEEDAYNSTLLACFESISRNGLADKTDQGCLNYFFKAFKMNLNIKDKFSKRLSEVTDDRLVILADDYMEGEPTTEQTTKRQLFNDFALMYVMKKIEENFDTITYNVFRLKHLTEGMTYQRLASITGIKDVKKRCIQVKRWLQENISKKDVKEAFDKEFDMINNF